jgi:sugar lactone lactonase YvrE
VVDRAVGAAIPIDADRLIVCRQGELSLLDRDSGALSVFAALEPEQPEMRPNDGKCDPAGRLWLGTTRFEHDLGVGRLYQIDPDGSIRPMLDELWCSNGMAWSADGSEMYFTDSPTRVVDRFSFDIDRGELSDHHRFVEIAIGDALPDGMCTDVDGGLWVALWGGGCIQRFDRDGTLTEQRGHVQGPGCVQPGPLRRLSSSRCANSRFSKLDGSDGRRLRNHRPRMPLAR